MNHLYKLAKKIYWQIRRFKARWLGTKAVEKKFYKRPAQDVVKYIGNFQQPHRQLLIAKIKKYQPLNNILEIGSGYGPNLYLLAQSLPQTKLFGVDISQASISEGRRFFAQKGIKNVFLKCQPADALKNFPDKSFDLVFTDALLIYISPDKIRKVVKEILRLARQAVIFNEWHCPSVVQDPQGLGVFHRGHWKRNYQNLLAGLILPQQIKLTKIPKNLWLPSQDWQNLGYIIEINLKK